MLTIKELLTLAKIWTFIEKKNVYPNLTDLKLLLAADKSQIQDWLQVLKKKGFIEIEDKRVVITQKGEKYLFG
jgi:Mn-dependent DtxR family transcriptional regulator